MFISESLFRSPGLCVRCHSCQAPHCSARAMSGTGTPPLQDPFAFDDVTVIFSGDEWEMLNDQQRTLYMDVMKENYEHFIFLGYKVPIILSWNQDRHPTTESSVDTRVTKISDYMAAVGSHMETRALQSEKTHPALPTEFVKPAKATNKRLREEEREDCQNQNDPISSSRSPKKQKKLCCPKCDKCFNYSSGLEAHLRVHSGDRPHRCDSCNETFTYKSELIVHRRKHSKTLETGRKPTSRSLTDNSILEGSSLTDGEASKGNSTDGEPSKSDATNCEPSKRSNPTNGEASKGSLTDTEASKMAASPNYSYSRTNKQDENDKPLKCNYCEKRFNSQSILDAHHRIHTGKLPYPCQYCNESFSMVSLLVAHSNKHNERKPYQCDQCERGFNDNSLFLAHKRTHMGEKPYQCKECNSWFPNNNSLVSHEQTHHKPKPYKCRHCDKSFNNKSLFKTHEGVHTGAKRPKYAKR